MSENEMKEIKVYKMPELLQFWCNKIFKETTAIFKVESDGQDITRLGWILDQYLITKYNCSKGESVIIYFPLKQSNLNVKNLSDC